MRRFLLYLIRWQLSTPILAPVVAIFTHSGSWFGTAESWIGSAVANLIGGSIFYWVDKFIFTSDKFGAIWQVKEKIACIDCGKITRCYRLVKTKDYDRTHAPPQFRCEECSINKAKELKLRGIKF
jgi:hypothetical protein